MVARDTQENSQASTGGRPWWKFWHDIHRDVVYVEYDSHERERLITQIVDDGGFKFLVFFVAASGFLAASYCLFASNVVTPALLYVYPPAGRLSGNPGLIIDEVTYVGVIVGMLVMGHLADRGGRKRWYGVELAALIIACMGVLQASEGYFIDGDDRPSHRSMNIYAWICWWKFLLGYGIGAEYPLSAVITAEWASTESRGIMLSAVFAMQSLGRLLAFTISVGALRETSRRWDMQATDTSDTSKLVVDQVWRWTVGISIIPAAIAIVLRLTIPETPRYYADIMQDLRKAVKNAQRLYSHRRVANEVPAVGENAEEDEHWYDWYVGAWGYLTDKEQSKPKKEKPWRRLLAISVLWLVLDLAWYGLSMDSPSALSTLAYDPSGNSTSYDFGVYSNLNQRRSYNGPCPGANTTSWNNDCWISNSTIYDVLEINSLRSIVVVSVPSLIGSIGAILIIDIFRRRIILTVTFLILSLLFAVSGATLIGTYEGSQYEVVTTVFYALLQFTMNLGPNTLIFVLAAEIFPTVYRGTFYGLAAATGKVGAIIIRVITFATTNWDMPLGIRLLVLVPFMLASAWISWAFIPDVQETRLSDEHARSEVIEQNGTNQQPSVDDYPRAAECQQQEAERRIPSDQESEISSDNSFVQAAQRTPTQWVNAAQKAGLFSRLTNMTLEDIAPNPT